MTHIAIVGAGQVGGRIGTAWARKGHKITYLVRDTGADHLKALLAAGDVSVTDKAGVAASADVILLALPWMAAEGAVRGLGDLTGKIVIDCMNPLVMKDGTLQLERGFETSGAETLAGWVPDAHVVKTLNQVGADILGDAGRLERAPVMFLAGDDDDAKKRVSVLVSDLGFEAADAGPLRQARLLEPLAMLWINQAIRGGMDRDWAFSIIRTRS